MLAALRSDFKGSRVSIGELEKLITLDSERAEFLRMLADGLQKSGDRLAAVDAYLKLADLQWGQGEPESVEPNLSVRRDRWVEARMEAIYYLGDVRPTARKSTPNCRQRLKTVLAGKNDKELRAYANYFSFHPTADDARAELVRQLTGSESMIERQSLLSELERSGDPAQRRMATARNGGPAAIRFAARRKRRFTTRRLKTDFADQVCLDGKTGKQIVAELPANSPETRAIAESTTWPSGAVKANSNRNAGGMNFQRPMPIAWQGDRGPFFQSTTILYDPQQQIVGRDGLGREKFRIPLERSRAESIRLSADQRDHRIRQRQGESVVRQSRHASCWPSTRCGRSTPAAESCGNKSCSNWRRMCSTPACKRGRSISLGASESKSSNMARPRCWASSGRSPIAASASPGLAICWPWIRSPARRFGPGTGCRKAPKCSATTTR